MRASLLADADLRFAIVRRLPVKIQRSELGQIAKLGRKHDVFVLCEVEILQLLKTANPGRQCADVMPR